MRVEIPKATELEQKVFSIDNEKDFLSIAFEVFDFQFNNNLLYASYCRALARTPGEVQNLADIPFLPISFFKSHEVKTGQFTPELVFKSSGTTGQVSSSHQLRKAALYEESFFAGFHLFFGPVEDYCILGLLPSYLERGNSSLVYMVDQLIKRSGHPESGFYLHDLDRLATVLKQLEARGQKTILFGVTYALLDLAAKYPQPLRFTKILETGGMKGRGREMTRQELYEQFQEAFSINEVFSEYGMTELLSQAYGVNGRFRSPAWMKLLLRDDTDPLTLYENGFSGSGAINVIDLANLYSCSFIATEDVGRMDENGGFEVLGRLDNADIRGCSLLVL